MSKSIEQPYLFDEHSFDRIDDATSSKIKEMGAFAADHIPEQRLQHPEQITSDGLYQVAKLEMEARKHQQAAEQYGKNNYNKKYQAAEKKKEAQIRIQIDDAISELTGVSNDKEDPNYLRIVSVRRHVREHWFDIVAQHDYEHGRKIQGGGIIDSRETEKPWDGYDAAERASGVYKED